MSGAEAKRKANDAMNTAPEAEEQGTSEGSVRVILADSQSIYRVGTRKIFALEDDIRVVAQAENMAQVLAALAKFPADVLLFESSINSNAREAVAELHKKYPQVRIILLCEECDEEETVEFYRRGAHGIISRAIAPDMLVRCVRKVATGEYWIDHQGVNWVIEAYRAQAAALTGPRPKAKLSEKELHIISCVTQGMRNKEIATEIGTTEQVVKNYLRKIYDKLGVSDRLELALYCIHHRLLGGTGSEVPEGASAATSMQPISTLKQ